MCGICGFFHFADGYFALQFSYWKGCGIVEWSEVGKGAKTVRWGMAANLYVCRVICDNLNDSWNQYPSSSI